MNRQKWNHKVLALISNKYVIRNNNIRKLIDSYPQQRFGQIICNYICPDYRDTKPSYITELWLRTDIFPKDIDFFYEEPWETFKRLNI